jgi:hypothetical protein
MFFFASGNEGELVNEKRLTHGRLKVTQQFRFMVAGLLQNRFDRFSSRR